MDLLKIFRMQEPVPKDLLAKNSELGKYKEVVQEKDVLLRNSKARIRELEQQVLDLESKNSILETQIKDSNCQKTIEEYEIYFSKIMSDSQEIIQEKKSLESKLIEMESFSKAILEKYEKSKEIISQYELLHEKLKNQILEYENVIKLQTNEYNRVKDYFQSKEGDGGFFVDKEDQQRGLFKDIFVQKQLSNKELQKHILEKRCSKSMFEPLKGLDK